jgi:hypothetical protein
MTQAVLAALIVFNHIVDAGNTITAFSLLLYGLTFNLRERVARTFAILLTCITIVYFTDVLVGSAQSAAEQEMWLRLQWIGIAFVPTASCTSRMPCWQLPAGPRAAAGAWRSA